MTVPLARLLHRSAPRQAAGACWEYDVRRSFGPPRPLILARIVIGADVLDLEIPVCSSMRPRVGAWSIRLVDRSTWRVSSARYGDLARGDSTMLEAFSDWLPVGTLDLLGAPGPVHRDLLAIDGVPL